jgi:hypothetical protein
MQQKKYANGSRQKAEAALYTTCSVVEIFVGYNHGALAMRNAVDRRQKGSCTIERSYANSQSR